jgi:hypothetical protein
MILLDLRKNIYVHENKKKINKMKIFAKTKSRLKTVHEI